MPETRTFDPDDGNELGKLVREALGETLRPAEPGAPASATTPPEDSEQDTPPGLTTAALWEGGNFGPTISF